MNNKPMKIERTEKINVDRFQIIKDKVRTQNDDLNLMMEAVQNFCRVALVFGVCLLIQWRPLPNCLRAVPIY